MISLQVTNFASPTLRKAVADLGNTEPVHRQISVQFYSWTIRNFDAAGLMQNPPWKPLSERTLKQKRRLGYSLQPLLRTGNLRQSFTPYADKRVAGVGARASYVLRNKKRFDYATVHQQGNEHIPARPMLPPVATVQRIAFEAYRNFVARSIGQASRA